MPDHETHQSVAKPGAIGESDDRAEHRAVEGEHINCAETEYGAEREGIEGDADVVGEDLTGTDLAGFIQLFPPVRTMVDYDFTKVGADAGELGKIRIVTSTEEGDRAEQPEDTEGHGRIPPGPAKSARKLERKKIAHSSAALRVGAVNPAVGANHQAVQVVDETRIA